MRGLNDAEVNDCSIRKKIAKKVVFTVGEEGLMMMMRGG